MLKQYFPVRESKNLKYGQKPPKRKIVNFKTELVFLANFAFALLFNFLPV